MFYIYALIFSLLTAGALIGAIVAYRKFASGGGAAAMKQKNAEIELITDQIKDMIQYENGYASPLQSEQVHLQITELREAFATQSQQLKEIEESLGKAQKAAEEKESRQQEYKTLKEEDEVKLTELLTVYETLSEESVALEQELALSLKNLEEMLAGTNLTAQERDILTEFNDSLLSAGGRLRDLMTEYQVVKERLEGLQGQFKDLEDEYTRLVEQQLGVG